MDDLRDELDEIKQIQVWKEKEKKLRAYQSKLASLNFLENCTTSLIRVAAA